MVEKMTSGRFHRSRPPDVDHGRYDQDQGEQNDNHGPLIWRDFSAAQPDPAAPGLACLLKSGKGSLLRELLIDLSWRESR